MLTPLFDKKPAGRSIGTLNSLAIAMVCVVWVGMLLIETDKAEHMESEMQQYQHVKPVKTDTRKPVYNPFALASDDTVLAKKTPMSDWVVTDVEFEKNYDNRSILNNLLHKSTPTAPSSQPTLSLAEVQRIFEALKPVTLALEHYYHRHQKWPLRLGDAGLDALPQNVSAISVSARGKLTIDIHSYSDIIHLNPKSLLKPIKWFCQTSLHNHLLGKGGNRLCIHNGTLASVGKLQHSR